MSIVLTTRQARGLQRCSTSPCIVCDRDARLCCFATVEEWITIPSEGMTERTRVIDRAIWPLCAKDKHFRGVVVLDKGHGQFRRAIVHPDSDYQLTEQP